MTNFIELQFADDLQNYTDQAVFLGATQEYDVLNNNNIGRINDLLEAYERYTIQESILSFFESVDYPIEALAELYNTCIVGDDPDDFENSEEFEDNNITNTMDAIEYNCGEFLTDIIYYIECEQNNGINLTDKFLDYLGLQTFTVGYSPWSRVVTFKGQDPEFYNDLWNGWNFYDVAAVDEQGDVIDAIGWIYARTDQELRDEVKAYFGFDNFKLINNEAAALFDIETAETITTYK